jgi:hypothetical protein
MIIISDIIVVDYIDYWSLQATSTCVLALLDQFAFVFYDLSRCFLCVVSSADAALVSRMHHVSKSFMQML